MAVGSHRLDEFLPPEVSLAVENFTLMESGVDFVLEKEEETVEFHDVLLQLMFA